MKISKQLTKTVAEAIRQGYPNRFACAIAGIAERTYYRWHKRGEEIFEAERVCETKMDDACLYFYFETEKAHADYVHMLVTIIHQAAERDWKAAAWILERRYPEEYSRVIRYVFVRSKDRQRSRR